MFRILAILFILVPIIEIAVFIQVGDQIGLSKTLVIVILTAIIGVNLLKQQGFVAWRDIQLSIAQGKMPAVEMAAGAQLIFAGGLLLTPGFVTDTIGFLLMIPAVRRYIANKMISRGTFQASASFHANQSHGRTFDGEIVDGEVVDGEVVEGEVVDENKQNTSSNINERLL